MAILIAGVALLVTGVAFARWQGDRFPARSEPLAGTPVTLHVQDGVTSRELRAIRAGVRLVDGFTRRALGREVRGPVEARVARRDRCRGSHPRDRDLIGEGSRGFLCVDTANVQWQVLIHSAAPAATAVSGHEYVHVLQAELGCLQPHDEPRYHWISEGMATHVAWRALVAAGRATNATVRTAIERDGAFDPGSEPLRHYERANGRTPQYALWHAAIRFALRQALRSGAAPARTPEAALIGFCERVGSGAPWGRAFEDAFGLPLEDFYRRFEAARPKP